MFKNFISVLKEISDSLFKLSRDVRLIRIIESGRERKVVNHVVVKLPKLEKKRRVRYIIKN